MTFINRISAWLRRAGDSIDCSFGKLQRIRFDAPWRERQAGRC